MRPCRVTPLGNTASIPCRSFLAWTHFCAVKLLRTCQRWISEGFLAFEPQAGWRPPRREGQKAPQRRAGRRVCPCQAMVRKRNRIHGGRKSLYNTEGWNQCPRREMCFSPISPVGKRAGQSRQYCRRSRAERFAPLRRIYRRSQQPAPARLRPPTSAWRTGRPA